MGSLGMPIVTYGLLSYGRFWVTSKGQATGFWPETYFGRKESKEFTAEYATR